MMILSEIFARLRYLGKKGVDYTLANLEAAARLQNLAKGRGYSPPPDDPLE